MILIITNSFSENCFHPQTLFVSAETVLIQFFRFIGSFWLPHKNESVHGDTPFFFIFYQTNHRKLCLPKSIKPSSRRLDSVPLLRNLSTYSSPSLSEGKDSFVLHENRLSVSSMKNTSFPLTDSTVPLMV